MIEIRIYSDDPRIFLRAIAKTLWANVRYLTQNLLPFVPLSIPFTLVIAQCVVRYAFDPIALHTTDVQLLAGQGTTLARDARTCCCGARHRARRHVSRRSAARVAARAHSKRRRGVPGVRRDARRFLRHHVHAGGRERDEARRRRRGRAALDATPSAPAISGRACCGRPRIRSPRARPSRIAFEYPDADLGWLPSGPGGVLLVFLVSSMLFGRARHQAAQGPDLSAIIGHMKLLLALCLLVPFGCSAEVMPPPRAYVTKMSLAEGKESYLECNTGAWTGRVTIAPDVKVGYKNVTVTTPRNAESKTTLTLNEVMMTVEKNGLLFGTNTRVPLSGEVAVEVRSDGVYMHDKLVATLPAK
jgi:hypothetical protein